MLPQQGIALRTAEPHVHLSGERCPWCDQPIPNEKLLEIQARISAKERDRDAELERRTKELVAFEKAQVEAKAKADLEQVRNEGVAALERARKEAIAKEGAAREEARKAAESAMTQKLAEAEQAQKTAEQNAREQREALEKAKLEAVTREAAAREEARKTAEAAIAPKLAEAEQARKIAEHQAKEQREALEKAKTEAAAREAAAREEVRKATEAAMASKLVEAEQAKKAAEQQTKEQREALEKAKTEAVNAEKAKHFEEKLKLDEKLQQLQRQLQQKTAEELGEGAELDLFEALRAEFPDDQITRVGKGTPGADIVHKVIYNDKLCGSIVYDSKNRNAWRNDYVAKLRQDQLSESADHAVLASQVFPSGARQLHIQDGVVIANPARVIALAQMLRRHVVQTHSLRLSNEARQQKTERLYEFVTSDRCAQLLDHIENLTDDMLELEVKEKKVHDTTWKRRGELLRSVQRARGNFMAEIESIIGTAATKE